MKQAKYYGYWSTGSSYNRGAYEFTSLREARKTMRAIAKGNNTGSGCRWWILDSLEEEHEQDEHMVASGSF